MQTVVLFIHLNGWKGAECSHSVGLAGLSLCPVPAPPLHVGKVSRSTLGSVLFPAALSPWAWLTAPLCKADTALYCHAMGGLGKPMGVGQSGSLELGNIHGLLL